jgi:hypothetical protein
MPQKTILVTALLAAALAAPIAAQAAPTSSGHNGLRVQLVLPVAFGPFPGCADGASYQVVSGKGTGTGTTCLLTDPDFTPCHQGNGFCRDLSTQTVLSLAQGTIGFDANQNEVVLAFDPQTFAFTVHITWSGSVTAGTHKFRNLVGATVSGGGTTSFDANGAQTGDLSFLIGEADDD